MKHPLVHGFLLVVLSCKSHIDVPLALSQTLQVIEDEDSKLEPEPTGSDSSRDANLQDSEEKEEDVIFGATCSQEDLKECLAFAVNLYFGRMGEEKDRARAMDLARDACDKGLARSCSRLADWLVAAGNPNGALSASVQGCDYGDMYLCGAVGVMMLYSDSVSRDFEKGLSLLVRACDASECGSCMQLAEIYTEGVGPIKPNRNLATSYRKRVEALPGCLP